MSKKRKGLALILGLLAGMFMFYNFSSHINAMENNAEIIPEQKKQLSKLSKNVKKKSKSTFSGATTYKGVLVLVLSNSSAKSLASGESGQNIVFLNEMRGVQYAKKNSLATNGILITGAYGKLGDSRAIPVMTAYYSKDMLDTIDFKSNISSFDNLTDIYQEASNYYFWGQYLQLQGSKGLLSNEELIATDGAPDWFLDVAIGHQHFKPYK